MTAWEDWQSQIPRRGVSLNLAIFVVKIGLTVTCDDQEFIIICQIMAHHIGESCYYLLLRRKLGALLELKIPYRSGESQVTVDTAKIDKTTGCGNTSLLA